jgi:hypothetical protein
MAPCTCGTKKAKKIVKPAKKAVKTIKKTVSKKKSK